jgi:hypothetical protein
MSAFRASSTLPLRLALLWSSLVVLAAGCVAAPTTGASPSAAAAVASPVASPTLASSGLATPVAPLNSTAASTGPTPALPPATVDVSPAQVPVGQFSVSMAVQPARHMLPQAAALTGDPDPAHQASSTSSTASSSTSLVLEGLLQLTYNVDVSQPMPDDQPQSMVRHVGVEVRAGDTGATVPYLSATVDMLLDGHPVISSVALEPMVSGDSTTAQLYYGNNLKLTQRGSYQAFVRLAPNALLGTDPPPAAQFDLVVH